MAVKRKSVVKASRLANIHDGRPAIVANPLPPVGTEVTFTIDGLTFRGTPAEHIVLGEQEMAVFPELTPA